jgi:antirestriction protein ArdC
VAKSRDKRDLDLDRDFGAYILRSGVALPPGEDDLYDPYEDGIGVQNLDSTTRHGGNHYYWRLARAIILSTGHHERLDRKTMAGSSSSTDDSWEALIATIGATMLCAALGMAPVDCAIVDSIRIESGEHDQRWRVRWQWLSGSKYRLVKAATQAQEAADYVLDVIRGVVDPTAKRAKKRRRDAESESE